MKKKRTRKEKITPNYQFIFKKNQVAFTQDIKAKSRLTKDNQENGKKKEISKSKKEPTQDNNTAPTKKNILKSLVLTTLILTLELVLFLALR